MLRFITKFVLLSMGLALVFHGLFKYFGVYDWKFLIFGTRYFLVSTILSFSLVASLPQLASKKLIDSLPIVLELIIGFYLALTAIDYILSITF